MRLLKFFAVFAATAILIFGFVLGWNWKAFNTFLDNRGAFLEGNEWVAKTNSLRGLSEFMGENPQHASVASIVINHPDSSIFYQENELRVLGTTSNFFILVAYAMAMDEGSQAPGEWIEWSEISGYQLPDVDASVHRESFRAADNRGWIHDGSITLQNSLRLLAEYSDLALADYLWWKARAGVWDGLKQNLRLEHTEMPLPYSGLYLAISPEFQNRPVQELIDDWLNASQLDWRRHVEKNSYDYIHSAEWRDQINAYMNRNRLGNTFMEERDAMILFPKTTAAEMTELLQRLMNDELVNESVSQTVKDFMRWPMENQTGIKRDFIDYGAIYDNRMGLMNGIDFGTSAYTGDTTVQAFFLDRLPIGFWFHASGGHMHQDFMQRLIFDPAMITQMKRVID